MLDVKAPTTDGRRLTLTRYTQPDAAQQLILARLELTLPPQPSSCEGQANRKNLPIVSLRRVA